MESKDRISPYSNIYILALSKSLKHKAVIIFREKFVVLNVMDWSCVVPAKLARPERTITYILLTSLNLGMGLYKAFSTFTHARHMTLHPSPQRKEKVETPLSTIKSIYQFE